MVMEKSGLMVIANPMSLKVSKKSNLLRKEFNCLSKELKTMSLRGILPETQ
jgi:hypothetical protein